MKEGIIFLATMMGFLFLIFRYFLMRSLRDTLKFLLVILVLLGSLIIIAGFIQLLPQEIEFLMRCLWYLVPAGLANMAPVLIGQRFKLLSVPIDFNSKIKGKSIFGQNKTWRGFLSAIVLGTSFFFFQQWLYQFPLFERISLIDYRNCSITLGFLLSFGAIFGDLIKSFFKRRVNIPPGKNWFPFDQIDWVLGTMAFSSILFFPSWPVIFVSLFLALIFYWLLTGIAVIFKMKNST